MRIGCSLSWIMVRRIRGQASVVRMRRRDKKDHPGAHPGACELV